MKKGTMIPNPANKRENASSTTRANPNKVIRQIACFYKLGKDGMSDLKAALVRNARDVGMNFKTYVSSFWSVLLARGGLTKVKKTTVLRGNLFAFA